MLRFIVYIMMCLLYIAQGLINNTVISIAFILITVLAFQQAFYKLHRKDKIFAGALFVSGIFIHFLYGNRWLELFTGITQNLPLLSIVLLAPLISLPLKGEGTLESVTEHLKELRNNRRKIFYGISSFMLVLAPILNMGAIRIVHSFVDKLKIDNKLLSNAYFGGFTPAPLWSPFYSTVGIVIALANISYISYMPVGITFAIIQLIIALLIMSPPKDVTEISSVDSLDSKLKKSYLLLISYIFFLMSVLIISEVISQLQILLLVSIYCLVIPLLWTLIRWKWSWMKKQIVQYKNDMIMNTNMEIALFLSAGLFGNALLNTPIASGLKSVILLTTKGTVLLVFLFVFSFITATAFIGIHQIISVPVIFPLLLMPEVGITLHAAAFMCIFSWMLSTAISPLNAFNIIVSQCVRSNGIKVAFNWNGKFFLVSFIVASIYIVVLNQF